MADRLDPIGVRSVWDGSDFVRGFKEYNRLIGQANKIGEEFARQLQATGASGSRAFQQFDRDTKRSLKSAERSTKNYLATAKDLQAFFQETSQLAGQFGGALREAAAGTDIRRSFESLAKFSGVSADQLIANMKRASRGTVAELDLIRIANRALLAGGDQFAKELPRLFEIARAASAATGQDIGFVFDTLTRGIAKASPLLIDNAEIYIKVGQAVDKYAAKLGKSTDELTSQERQQATLNAVLDEGGEFIERVGSDAELATDKFGQFNAKVEDAKSQTASFISDALGPLGPLLKETAGLFQTLVPLLQTYVILQQQAGAGGLLKGLGGLSGLAAGAAPAAAVAGGIGLGVAGYEKIIRKLDSDLPSTARTIDILGKSFKTAQIAITDGKHAAREWLRAAEGIPTLAERGAAALERQADVIAQAETYSQFITQIGQINNELEAGEIALGLISQAEFDYEKAISDGNLTLEERLAVVTKLNQERARSGDLLGALSQATNVTAAASQAAAEAARQAAQAENERVTALTESARLSSENVRTLADLRRQLFDADVALRQEERRLNQQAESEEARHQAKMVELAEKAAQDRRDAARDLQRSLADAERTRQRAVEDAQRNHAQRVQDIENEHRRRLRDIEENYTKTVKEAAIDRDALAILQARERREEEIRDANEQRQDALSDEQRSFEDQLRQAQEAFRQQTEAARRTYMERLRDIDETLAQERQKEQAAWNQKLADMRQRNNQELQEEQEHYRRLEKALQDHLSRMQQIRGARVGRGGDVNLGEGPGGRMGVQHGFDGVVTGPQTFFVEPGVTEYVYASGDLSKRQSVLPSPAAAQMGSMRAMVSGAVGVGLQGFSGGLMDRIGPQLQESVGQAVVDELTDAILRTL